MRYALPILLLLAACSSPIPQYMKDAPRTDEDTRRIVAEIERELGEDFYVEQVEGIFFVATNEGPLALDACKGTVSRVFTFLKKDYFKTVPTRPIRVFLFRDKETYSAYCEKTYGRKPSTPFGFYMSDERKMVMNIATGRGTLAHELVHPLLAADFPGVPAWFNEGFASLFEQSRRTRDGKMVGLVNWRLPGLRKAIRMDGGVSLLSILSTTTSEFYGDNRGVNYAAARYLCLYLQELGLLRKFYVEFKRTHVEDPTGTTALRDVTNLPFREFQRRWERWVQDLRWND